VRIIIAPTEIKVIAAKRAAKRAARDLGINVTIAVSKSKPASELKAQPRELIEAHVGASNRTIGLFAEDPNATHALGVENTGVYVGGGKNVDIAVVSLFDRQGCETTTTSQGFPMPAEALGMSLLANQDQTGGSFIARLTGCDGADWMSHYSDGIIPRVRLIADAVYTAIVCAVKMRKHP
jgi:non-canonical (house-cleaning) NTP pyrophosphatase